MTPPEVPAPSTFDQCVSGLLIGACVLIIFVLGFALGWVTSSDFIGAGL